MKISIITVTYNSERTLEETIKSIRSQGYKDLEYIIVDGGSTDMTINIIKRNLDCITKWISEPDKGISDAFNKGIRMADGEVIGIINSDDLLAYNALQIIKDNIEENTDVFYGNGILFGGKDKEVRFRSDKNPNSLYHSMKLLHPATFIRKSAYEKFGMFDLSYKCTMDQELLLRMLANGAKFQYINADLAKMRRGGMNQKLYAKVTVPEGVKLSIQYGQHPIPAHFRGFYSIIRFYMVNFIKKYKYRKSGEEDYENKNKHF